jgi:hypothetical protein
MARVLLFATTTGYQTRAFGEAAERLGVELVFATDRCNMLEDPWQDGAIAIRFHDEDQSAAAVVNAARSRPIDGVLVVGDRPTVIAARVAAALGLPGHPPEAAAIAKHKLRTRERLRDVGRPVPWFIPLSIDRAISHGAIQYPCVLKPVALSGSRGVMRADDPASLRAAIERLRALLEAPDVRAERNEDHKTAIVEGFIPGREFAVEGLMHHGTLHVLAIFDKPDPLDGPFFEETIYVTPAGIEADTRNAIIRAVGQAAGAIGLHHGPIHAECRVNHVGVFVLEVAARPIGGLCARALRFDRDKSRDDQSRPIPNPRCSITLEELLLRHALGESPEGWTREPQASGVMMIPIPRRGIFRGVEGTAAAGEVPHVDDVRVTAKMEQLLLPLPEGASYLGFIFARAGCSADVETALRAAHARLHFEIAPEIPVYNHAHG